MTKEREVLDEFLVDCFYGILTSERRALEATLDLGLTFKEIHLVETVISAQKVGENTFSNVAHRLGVTLGTLTAAFSKLEQKGYLKKERYLIDQRVFYITPTAKAMAVHEQHRKWHAKLLDEIVSVVPAGDLPAFADGVAHLSRYFKTKS